MLCIANRRFSVAPAADVCHPVEVVNPQQSSGFEMLLPDRLSLKHRVLQAGFWSLGGYGLSQVIRFGSNLVMTRLLVPDMFGVMSIAMLVIVGLAMISDLGIKQSVIQSQRGTDSTFLNTAWAIQIYRGIVLWIFTLIIAIMLAWSNRVGFVATGSVYADPALPYVIAVLSILALLGGLQSTKIHEANRNLSLSSITTIELVAQLIGLICMLSWASIDRSIWCLLIGTISSIVAVTIMSHVCLPGTPNRWQWDSSAAQEIAHFGKWIMASSVLGFLVNNGDRLLLGAFVPPATLGIYVIAFSIFSSIDQVVTKVIGDLAFPALSEISRQNPNRLKAAYYRFFSAVSAFSYTCAGILIIAGQSIIDLLYDARYQQAGWMLQILAVAVLTMPFRLAAMSLLALGRSRSFFVLIVIRVLFLVILTPLGFHFFGFTGALIAIVLSYFSTVPMSIVYAVRLGFFDTSKELLLLVTLAGGMLIGGAIKMAAAFL